MIIKPIKTHEDHQAALAEVERLFDVDKTAEEYDQLDLLSTLVESYEAKHYAIGPPDPIAAIEYEMEKRGLTRRDLEPIIGPSGRVSEVMNRHRPLTMTMIRNLHDRFGLSADILLAKYPLVEIKSPQKRSTTHVPLSKRSDLSVA
jgi:HTH-type transcriptional regulator/antitoxin HigA